MSLQEKKIWVLHPLLFAIFPVLFLFTNNIDETMFTVRELGLMTVAKPLLVVLVAFGALFWGLWKWLGNSYKAGLIVSLAILTCFSYGHVETSLQMMRITFDWGWQIEDSILMPTYLAALAIGIYTTLKSRRDFITLTRVLNAMALFIVAISLGNITLYTLRHKNTSPIQHNAPATTAIAGEKPDIYYFILDRYAAADILQTEYGFDNSEFLQHLESKGFFISSRSVANYPITSLSLASSLNMQYLDHLTQKYGENTGERSPLYEMILNSKASHFLRSQGYTYIHSGSWWAPTSLNPSADLNINITSGEFSLLLYRTTIFYPLGFRYFRISKESIHYRRIFYKFDRLAEIPQMPEPTFLLSHMLLPHDPYIVDKNGNFMSYAQVQKQGWRASYIEQLQFTNRKMCELIDKILANSPKPPIIIIQADEGPYPERYRLDEDGFDWHQATQRELRQKIRILNAYYFPGVEQHGLYPEITPVNSFRRLFDLYFATQHGLLEDKNYFHSGSKYIYKFFEVSDQVKY